MLSEQDFTLFYHVSSKENIENGRIALVEIFTQKLELGAKTLFRQQFNCWRNKDLAKHGIQDSDQPPRVTCFVDV